MTANQILAAAAAAGWSALTERDLAVCNAYTTAALANLGPGTLLGAFDPENNIVGQPGQTYFNTANQTFWVHTPPVASNTGWVQLN